MFKVLFSRFKAAGRKEIRLWILPILFCLSAILCIYRLDNAAFWDDEAYVGLVAKNFLSSGRLTGWDGRNLYAYANGSVLSTTLRPINPPLDVLVAAASFSILGPGTWSARIPFVIAGLVALGAFGILLRREFPTLTSLQVYCFSSLAFSVVFLLNIRTARYYALALLFSLGAYLFYRLLLRKLDSFRLHLVGLCLCLTALFYSNYLLCASFALAMTILHCSFHRRAWNRQQYQQVLVALTLFMILTLPYALAFRIWQRPDIEVGMPWLFKYPYLMLLHVLDLSTWGFIPLLITISLLVLGAFNKLKAVRYKARLDAGSHKLSGTDPEKTVSSSESVYPIMGEWGVLIAAYIFAVTLFLRQPVFQSVFSEVRYWLPILPYCAGLSGCFFWLIHKNTKIGAAVFLMLSLCTNLLMLHPWDSLFVLRHVDTQFRWMLPAYAKEISKPYPTSSSAVSDFLKTHAKQDETVYGFPEFMNYPIMFYVGDKIKVCCTLSQDSHLPQSVIRNLKAPLFVEENFPHWYIAYNMGNYESQQAERLNFFSRRHYENGRLMVYPYRFFNKLNVFWVQTQRPEFAWHSFGPIDQFDEKSSVYIFKRDAPIFLKNGQREQNLQQ